MTRKWEPLVATEWDQVQNSRAETLFIDQWMEEAKPVLLSTFWKGRWAGFLWHVKGEGVSASSLWVGAWGILRSSLLAQGSFCTRHPITILDLSGLDWFCYLASWHCSTLVPKAVLCFWYGNVLGTSLGDITTVCVCVCLCVYSGYLHMKVLFSPFNTIYWKLIYTRL